MALPKKPQELSIYIKISRKRIHRTSTLKDKHHKNLIMNADEAKDGTLVGIEVIGFIGLSINGNKIK